MKKDIHPKYNENVDVTCSCGAKFSVGTTMDEMKIEICSNCHPFYTGNDKTLDTAGRVDKFNKRFDASKKESK